jgi:protein phosphatase
MLRQGHLRQLTRDHSRVWPLIESRQITWDELRFHPDRSKVTNALTARRSGVVPEVQEFGLEPGDQLLLCSDGLTGEVRPEEVEQILRDYPADQAAELLIKGANASTTVIKDGQSVVLPGGNDNITLIIVNIPGDQPLPDPTLQIVPETTLETMKVETAPLETTKVDKTPVSTKSPWSRRMKRITSGLYILLLIIGAVLDFSFLLRPTSWRKA